ncbi:MAG: hypothetical protein Q8P20_04505 [bacterium]|nr:hypothetical protein [bacterium]
MKRYNKPTIIVNTHGKITQKKTQKILVEQKRVAHTILKKLNIPPPKVITIHLYNTRGQKEKITGEKGNCHADIKNNKIHAFLPKGRKTLGHHEMVHILTKHLGSPPKLLTEGLALWFDKSWHGVAFSSLVKKMFISEKHGHLVNNIFSDSAFKKIPNLLSYNITGLITSSLIHDFGLSKYLKLYKKCKRKNSLQKNLYIFNKIYKFEFPLYLKKLFPNY